MVFAGNARVVEDPREGEKLRGADRLGSYLHAPFLANLPSNASAGVSPRSMWPPLTSHRPDFLWCLMNTIFAIGSYPAKYTQKCVFGFSSRVSAPSRSRARNRFAVCLSMRELYKKGDGGDAR